MLAQIDPIERRTLQKTKMRDVTNVLPQRDVSISSHRCLEVGSISSEDSSRDLEGRKPFYKKEANSLLHLHQCKGSSSNFITLS